MKLPTLDEIFREIVEGTPSYNANKYSENVPFTIGIKNIFRKLGETYGYKVRDVNTNGEFLTIDLTWMLGDYIILAMEHENIDDPIPDEWRKLVNIKSRIKVLITYGGDEVEREELINQAKKMVLSNPYSLPGEIYFIVIGIPAYEGKKRKTTPI